MANVWKEVPGSFRSWGHEDCHVEVNTSTIKRLPSHSGQVHVIWQERMLCIEKGKQDINGGYVGHAICHDKGRGRLSRLIALDAMKPYYISFHEAQQDIHGWGMGNVGWRVACDPTR